MSGATQPLPEFVVTLSDGVNTIGLMTSNKSGIRRLPRSPGAERKAIRQEDWTGGRGSDVFRRDTTKFLDSINLHTTVEGHAMNGPLMRITDGRGTANKFSRRAVSHQPGTHSNLDVLLPNSAALAKKQKFTIVSGEGFTSDSVAFMARKIGTPAAALTVALHADNAGVVGAQIATVTLSAASVTDDRLMWRTASAAWNLTVAGSYWLLIYGSGNTSTNGWKILIDGINGEPYYRIAASTTIARRVKFFEYKRQLYVLVMYDAANAQLLMNGDRGVATGTQSAATLVDTTKTSAWLDDEWNGCVLYVTAGLNKGEYRTITDTVKATGTLTLETALPQACATGASGSEYVILGSDAWQEAGYTTALTGSGLTTATDVVVLGDVVYFAQGDAANMRRMREYNNAGVWARDFAEDGTNKATFILSAPDWSTNNPAIYKGNQDTVSVSVAPKVAWGTNLTFGTAIEITSKYSLLTGLAEYNNTVYAATDDNIWELKDGYFARVPITIDRARDERNGVALAWWNTQLFHSFQGGLERLYGSTVDDIGPDRGTGMEADRRGQIVELVPVANKLFALYYSPSGYSTVMETVDPGGNWHNLYTHEAKARKFSGLYYQTVPGRANRLWFSSSYGARYLVMPDDLHTPLHDSNSRYCNEGFLITGWFDAASPELDHFFDDIRFTTRYMGTPPDADPLVPMMSNYLEIEYQTDNADTTDAWTAFTTTVFSNPYSKVEIGDQNVTGRMIRFRLRFTCGGLRPAILNAMELRLVQMNEVMFDFIFDIQLGDRLMLMTGNDRTEQAEDVMAVIESWDEDATPLTMRVSMPNVTGLIDNLRGHIDPVALVTGAWNDRETRLSGNITFKSL